MAAKALKDTIKSGFKVFPYGFEKSPPDYSIDELVNLYRKMLVQLTLAGEGTHCLKMKFENIYIH